MRWAGKRKVSIGQTIHQPVGKGIQLLPRTRLRNAGSPVTCLAEGCDPYVSRPCELRVARSLKINVELPQIKRVRTKIEEVVGRACRRGCSSIEIGRQQSPKARTELKALLSGGGAVKHGGPLHGAYPCSEKRTRTPIKHIERHVIRVGPDSQLGIIR